MKMPYLSIYVCLATGFCASLVYADAPPPPEYDENCTIDKQQTEATECISCSEYGREPGACKSQDEYEKDGYTLQCRTANTAGSYDELLIWCRQQPKNEIPDAGSSPTVEVQDAAIDAGTIDRVDSRVISPGTAEPQTPITKSETTITTNQENETKQTEAEGDSTSVHQDDSSCNVAIIGDQSRIPGLVLVLGLVSLALFNRRRG